MDAVYFLIPIGLLILIMAIIGFCWAVNNEQFNDLDTPAHRVIFDDIENRPIKTPKHDT